MTNKIIRVDQDSAIAWAFDFMGRDSLTIDEISSYLEVLRGILPENYVLFGVSNAVEFVLERYPEVFALDGDVVYYTPTENSIKWFSEPTRILLMFEQASNILKAILEETDEIKTSNNMVLNRTN